MIEFKEVEKRYPNGYEALKHINLTIDRGSSWPSLACPAQASPP